MTEEGAYASPLTSCMTIIKTLTRAARHLNNVLNHDRQCLPYWMMAVTGEGLAEFEDRRYCSGHSLGRWWNAILRLEDSFGCQISADIETIMLQHAWDMSDNPAGIFLEDIQPDDPATWYIHSYRETMLAFAMIARYWDDDRAPTAAAALSHGCAMPAAISALRGPSTWAPAVPSPKAAIPSIPTGCHRRVDRV